jgi:hypothetical protein
MDAEDYQSSYIHITLIFLQTGDHMTDLADASMHKCLWRKV